MDERKKRVLSAIINDYIANAEPVGSRTITKRYDLGVSPATIRNEMSDLTEEGYIEQPHTSAGRVPSAKGYRYYVDNLMERERLSPAQIRQIREVVAGELSELDDFMHSCVDMISRLTNYTAIATVPEQGRGRIRNVQLVSVSERQILAILLSSTGIIRHKLIDMPEAIPQNELYHIEEKLYNALKDRNMSDISYEALRDLIYQMHLRGHMGGQAMEILEQGSRAPERIFTGGVMNMFSQPEFQDVGRLRNLVSLLQEDDKVKRLLSAGSQKDDMLTVAIGGEMAVEGAEDCSMVVANYFVNGEKAGSIGVLGPTRMSYGKTVSLMEQIAGELSRAMSDQNGNGKK